MTPEITVRIQDPQIGRGWYKLNVEMLDLPPDADDLLIFDLVRLELYPEATAVEITRRYKFHLVNVAR